MTVDEASGKPRRKLITLISVNQAKLGLVFIHRGLSSKCERCEFYQICVRNLEPGRVYRIVGLREKIISCKLFETEMRVVEVMESEIAAAIPAKQAIENAITTFKVVECNVESCENFEVCFPEGLVDGDRCEVVKVIEKNFRCPRGFPLVKVLLRRVSAS